MSSSEQGSESTPLAVQGGEPGVLPRPVADAQGLSYYSDASLTARLPLDRDRLAHARDELIGVGLIAFEPPLYQVLSLDPGATSARDRAPRSFAEVLRHIAGQP